MTSLLLRLFLSFVSIEKIYQTLELVTVFHRLAKHLEFRQKYSTVRCIFNSLLISVFGISRWNTVSSVWYITCTFLHICQGISPFFSVSNMLRKKQAVIHSSLDKISVEYILISSAKHNASDLSRSSFEIITLGWN